MPKTGDTLMPVRTLPRKPRALKAPLAATAMPSLAPLAAINFEKFLSLEAVEPASPLEALTMAKLDPSTPGGKQLALGERVRARVIGQESAVSEILASYARLRAGLNNPKRPAGIFLLVGPTGVGKTHTVQQIAAAISGRDDALLRIDCGEYAQSHEVAKLIGSPPGYLGHRETPPILEPKRLASQWSEEGGQVSFVLFDEIDKAHPRFLDILLGILDTGKLRLGDGQTTDFTSSIILLTANTGAQEMQEALAPRWGLAAAPHSGAKAGGIAEAAAKKVLRPELFNRLDKVLVFNPLSQEELFEVLQIELSVLEGRLLRQVGVGMTLSIDAKRFVLSEGYDPRYGARHLKRAIVKLVELPIVNCLLNGSLRASQIVRVELEKGALTFHA